MAEQKGTHVASRKSRWDLQAPYITPHNSTAPTKGLYNFLVRQLNKPTSNEATVRGSNRGTYNKLSGADKQNSDSKFHSPGPD